MRLVCGLLCLLLSGSALAQNKKSPKEEAAAIFQSAEAQFQQGQYEQALIGYQKAYELSKEPLLLFNIGQCYTNLKQFQKAIDAYETFLREAPDSPQRGLAESLITDNETELFNQTVASTQATATQKTPPPVEKPRSAKPFFVASGVSAGASLLLGGVAFSSALSAKKIQDDPAGNNADIAAPANRARALGYVADVFLVASIGAGAYGYVVSKQVKASEATVSLSPAGVRLLVSF